MSRLILTRPPRGTRHRRLVAVATAFAMVGAAGPFGIGTAQAALARPSAPGSVHSSGAPGTAGVSTQGAAATVGPVIDWAATNLGTTTTTTHVVTSTAGDLLVAFVSSGGPAGSAQKATVTSDSGLVWTLVKRTDAQRGTAEVWTAVASGLLDDAAVTASLAHTGYGLQISVFAFKQASGTGRTASASHATGAPTVSVTTSTDNSWVWAVGNDPTAAIDRTQGTNQPLMTQLTDDFGDTFWVQSTNSPTPAAGTKVTIYDTAPTNDRWNLALVEIH